MPVSVTGKCFIPTLTVFSRNVLDYELCFLQIFVIGSSYRPTDFIYFMAATLGSLASAAANNGNLLRYSVSAATLTALSWHVYQEYQKKAISGKSWQDIAREKKRNAAAAFCSYANSFYYSLRLARDHLHTGKVEEAMAVLVSIVAVFATEFMKRSAD